MHLQGWGCAEERPSLLKRAFVRGKRSANLFICPANWEVAAHLNHAAYGPEGGDVKSGNSGNPAEAETVKRQSHPLNVELFFFFFLSE